VTEPLLAPSTSGARPAERLLGVEDLVVRTSAGGRRLVDGIGFSIAVGESVGIVGESGSGKSMTARAVMGLLPRGTAAEGRVTLGDRELTGMAERDLRRMRGADIGLLMQDPFTILNPLTTAGDQLAETLTAGRAERLSRKALAHDVRRRLGEVGIADPAVAGKYPFELSGGMRQRVALAAAIARDPRLLIADEPTTALDATTQREVLALLRRIQRERRMGLLLITHDLRVAFSVCDRILVMRGGVIVEEADPATLRAAPTSDYTASLLAAEHALDQPRPAPAPSPDGERRVLLQASQVTKRFPLPRRRRSVEDWPIALDRVDLEVVEGRSVGVVGESGSGKTTLARSILGLERPTSGSIRVDGLELSRYDRLSKAELRQARRTVQCVFQDPYSSLNPSHTVGFILGEAIRQRGASPRRDDVAGEVAGLLERVGLPAGFAGRRPVALSGGQRQRIAIARALAARPRIIVCDEPVSALDVSVQAQVLDVLKEVQAQGVTLLFITHDLAVARQMTDDLVVLYRGTVVETGPTEQLLTRPQHDYTRRLLAAVPSGTPGWLA
jgi:peptide/nickel transport system ATP-binding protein